MPLPHHRAPPVLLIIAHHDLGKEIRINIMIEVEELEDRPRLSLSNDHNQ